MTRKCSKVEAGCLRGLRLWKDGYHPCPDTLTFETLLSLEKKGWVTKIGDKYYHFLNIDKGVTP